MPVYPFGVLGFREAQLVPEEVGAGRGLVLRTVQDEAGHLLRLKGNYGLPDKQQLIVSVTIIHSLVQHIDFLLAEGNFVVEFEFHPALSCWLNSIVIQVQRSCLFQREYNLFNLFYNFALARIFEYLNESLFMILNAS